MPSTLDWLRSLDDADLVALLRARPDLVVPAPGDLGVLAGRLNTGPSVWRAMETLTQFHIEVLTALAVLGAERHAAPWADLVALLGEDVPADALDAALARLRGLALVRGDRALQIPSAALNALGPYPAGLAAAGRMSPDDARTALDELSPAQMSIVDQLARGTPRGTVQPGSRVGRTVAELVAAGVVRQVDATTVELPREVALALRGGRPLGEVHPYPPDSPATHTDVGTVDGTGAGQATASVLRWRRWIEQLGRAPVPVLRSGGMGIRELRKVARLLDVEDSVAALDVELLVALGAVAGADLRSAAGQAWTPTSTADALLDQDEEAVWTQFAECWLDLRRAPWRAGIKDGNDKIQNALSPELSWLRGPVDRRFVLRALDELPPGSGLRPDDLSARLAWRSPLRPAEQREALIRSTVAEATALGVVAFDALTGAARPLLAGDTREAAAALSRALPARVEQLMIQADLTVIAPGRLTRSLAARMGQVADVESSGSATVYRVTPQTIRRALDAGATAAELRELFAKHSVTGVPQALEYLVDDVGRRHGRLRVGQAAAYLRSDDPALIDQAIAEAAAVAVPLRRLAPTVAVSVAGLDELMDQLRAVGLAPSAEDAAGVVVDLRPDPRRARPPGGGAHQHWREPPQPSDEQLGTVVDRMRAADRAGVGTRDEQQTHQAVALLRDAANSRSAVWIGYVDAEGTLSHRLIEPVAISGGAVVAYDRLRTAMRTFTLHRITAVRPADEPDTGGSVEDAEDVEDTDGLPPWEGP